MKAQQQTDHMTGLCGRHLANYAAISMGKFGHLGFTRSPKDEDTLPQAQRACLHWR